MKNFYKLNGWGVYEQTYLGGEWMAKIMNFFDKNKKSSVLFYNIVIYYNYIS